MTNTFYKNSANAEILQANNPQKTKNDDITRIICALEAGLPMPPDLAKKLIGALKFFLAGEYKTLCSALGWRRKRGERKDETKLNIEFRNHYLRVCLCKLTGKNTREFEFYDFTKLANEIARWDTVTRKNVSHLQGCDLTKMQRLLRNAESFAKLPSTPTGLWETLNK
jgi:hypothetical protein